MDINRTIVEEILTEYNAHELTRDQEPLWSVFSKRLAQIQPKPCRWFEEQHRKSKMTLESELRRLRLFNNVQVDGPDGQVESKKLIEDGFADWVIEELEVRSQPTCQELNNLTVARAYLWTDLACFEKAAQTFQDGLSYCREPEIEHNRTVMPEVVEARDKVTDIELALRKFCRKATSHT